MGNVQYLEYDEAVALIISTTNRLISMIDSLNEVNCADYITLFAESLFLIVWTIVIGRTSLERLYIRQPN